MGVLRKAIACAIMAVALFCIVPGLAMADEGASVRLATGTRDAVPCVDKVISTAWGSYEGCAQWLGVNAEVSGAAGEDELTFFLTASADGTEANLAAEGLSCTCTVADLPERKAGVYNAREKGPGFLVEDLPAGQYWLGCKIVSDGIAAYAQNPRSFIVYEKLADFVDAALERILACSRHDYLISEGEDGARSIMLGSGGDYGDDWEAWMLPALVSGGRNPLFSSYDAAAYLDSLDLMLDRVESGQLSDLSLKDYFRYITALCAVGEDPRDFRGKNLVDRMMQKAENQKVVENAPKMDSLFLSYFLLACKIACVTADDGFSVADEAMCYDVLLNMVDRTVGSGVYSRYPMSDVYAMMMLPLCLPVGDADLQERVDAAKVQMLEAYADCYQYGNGAISYGQPAADNGGFAQPNSNSSAVSINTFVFAGLGVEELAGSRWQKPYGSLMSAWMTQMNDNGWMTYAGNPADNDMATYQTLGALVDLHNGKSCFAIASERYLDAHPEHAAARVEDLIDALPDSPGLDDEGAVVGARAAYELLSTTQKGCLSNAALSSLVAAETAIAEAKVPEEAPESEEHAGGQDDNQAETPTASIVKLENTMSVSSKAIKIKAERLKKARIIKAIAVKDAVGKVSFKLVKIKAKKKLSKQARKRIRLTANGKVKLKRGLKKGTYRLSIRVKASGDVSHKPVTKTVVVKLVVK